MNRIVFQAIVAAGFVWPWVVMAAVDGYLGTGRLRNFFAVYTDAPALYLLLFVSQAFWSAVPFVAFAMVAKRILRRSKEDIPADLPQRRIAVSVAGMGALALFSWAQAVAWREYFLSPSGTSGIAIALAVPPALAMVAAPAFYGLGWRVGRRVVGERR